MVINITPEFDHLLENALEPVCDELKRLELSRRLVAASGCETEEDRTTIINYSDIFYYTIYVSNGRITIERNPSSEDNELIDDVRYETYQIIETIIPDKIETVIGNSPELINLFIPQISEQVYEEISKILGGDS